MPTIRMHTPCHFRQGTNRSIDEKGCRTHTERPGLNERGCCASACTSPWRLCIACIVQQDVQKEGVHNPQTGLCLYHETHGRNARRSKEKKVAPPPLIRPRRSPVTREPTAAKKPRSTEADSVECRMDGKSYLELSEDIWRRYQADPKKSLGVIARDLKIPILTAQNLLRLNFLCAEVKDLLQPKSPHAKGLPLAAAVQISHVPESVQLLLAQRVLSGEVTAGKVWWEVLEYKRRHAVSEKLAFQRESIMQELAALTKVVDAFIKLLAQAPPGTFSHLSDSEREQLLSGIMKVIDTLRQSIFHIRSVQVEKVG